MEILRSVEISHSGAATVTAELIVEHGEHYTVRLINRTDHNYQLLKTKDFDRAKAEFGYLLDMFGLG